MNDDEWTKKFKPIKNPHVADASYGGTMFETYGPELESVKAADPACVWTLVCGDSDEDEDDGDEAGGGRDFILKGYHHINRMGYFITTVPADDTTPDEIEVVF